MKIRDLFGHKQAKKPEVKFEEARAPKLSEKQINQGLEKFNAVLAEGLSKMSKEGVHRAIIETSELSPEEAKRVGGVGLFGISESRYYPFEMLDARERAYIERAVKGSEEPGVSYGAMAVVLKEFPGLVSFESDGIEANYRRRVYPMLPKLEVGSSLHYAAKRHVYTGDGLMKLLVHFIERGLTPEELGRQIDIGMKEFHAAWQNLLKGANEHIARLYAKPFTNAILHNLETLEGEALIQFNRDFRNAISAVFAEWGIDQALMLLDGNSRADEFERIWADIKRSLKNAKSMS